MDTEKDCSKKAAYTVAASLLSFGVDLVCWTPRYLPHLPRAISRILKGGQMGCPMSKMREFPTASTSMAIPKSQNKLFYRSFKSSPHRATILLPRSV